MKISTPIWAVLKKDIRNITTNKRMIRLLIVMTIGMSIFTPVFSIISLFNSPLTEKIGIEIFFNNILPIFLMFIIVSVSSTMASNSFVGEKEKRTLETLFYSPMPLKEIFQAKILASFLFSMAAAFLSLIIMQIAVQTAIFILAEMLLVPNVNWIIMMFLVLPSTALIAINFIVTSSSKSKSSEESNQRSMFLIIPIMFLMMGQFSRVIVMGPLQFLLLGIGIAFIAFLMFKRSYGKYNYEALLKA